MKTVFLVLTIGYPFSVFKALCGRVALDSGHEIIGSVMLLWGVSDFVLNSIELLLALFRVKRDRVYCVLAWMGSLFGRRRLFLEMDTLLAFSIICLVLWSGWIAKLAPIELNLWLAATTVNLLSVGIVQIWSAWTLEKGGE
ncbi:MAG: hypothetical protein KAG97_08600 [Victivallales bacterium]|nr:hypothetical protein [Victivallales bacterium]